MARSTGRAANPRGSPHTFRITALLNARQNPDEATAVECLKWGRSELGYTDRFFVRVALEAFWQMYKQGQHAPPEYGERSSSAGITSSDIDRLAATIEARLKTSILEALLSRGLVVGEFVGEATAVIEGAVSNVDMSAFGGEFFQFEDDSEEGAP